MKIFNAYKVVIMGARIRYLMSIRPESKVIDVSNAIINLLEELQQSDFEVTMSFIKEFLPKTLKILSEKRNTRPNGVIGNQIHGWINKHAESLEKTFLSEGAIKKLYALPTTRYNSTYLLETPDKLLRPGGFQKLSKIAKFDFASSCRCLVYGESTASAFHILRANEDVLKQYYRKFIKTKRLKSNAQTWGALTHALKNKKRMKPDNKIIESLDLIRIHYRNPTQHPLITYDMEEAQDLFGLCIDLINKMTLVL